MATVRYRKPGFLRARDFGDGWLRGMTCDQVYNAGAAWTLTDFQRIAGYGARITRCLIQFPVTNGQFGPMSSADTAKFDNWVSYCRQTGIYMVPCPLAPLVNDPMWSTTNWYQSFINAWTDLIVRYILEPAIGGWDIINEPNPFGAQSDNGVVFSMMETVTKALRKIDPNHVFVVGLSGGNASFGFGRPGADTLVSDANTVYSLHPYRPENISLRGIGANPVVTYPSGGFNKDWIYTDYQQVIDWQSRNRKPIFCGEWGISRYDPSSDTPRQQFMQDIIGLMNRNNWSWCYLGYRVDPAFRADCTSFNVGDNTNAENSIELNILRSYMGVANAP